MRFPSQFRLSIMQHENAGCVYHKHCQEPIVRAVQMLRGPALPTLTFWNGVSIGNWMCKAAVEWSQVDQVMNS